MLRGPPNGGFRGSARGGSGGCRTRQPADRACCNVPVRIDRRGSHAYGRRVLPIEKVRMAAGSAQSTPRSHRATPQDLCVFVSAAEPSADRHGAELIRETRALRPEIRFVGVCGPKMEAEGCECLFD